MLPSSQYWVVEAESVEQFRAEMAGADIAIDSSVLVATGNMSSHLDIVDVYRPQPEADIRWWELSLWSSNASRAVKGLL